MTKKELPSSNDVRTAVHQDILEYSNPHNQVVHPRWAGTEITGCRIIYFFVFSRNSPVLRTSR